MYKLTNRVKDIFSSLKTVKGRKEHGLFLVESNRAFREMSQAAPQSLVAVVALDEWWKDSKDKKFRDSVDRYVAGRKELKEIGTLQTTPPVIGVFKIENRIVAPESLLNELNIALDRVQDPGNLGTIIRIADWFGIKHIICSKDTADCYNPKVVQSSMGALGRVNVFQVETLSEYLADFRRKGGDIYGTFLDGENLFKASLSDKGVVVLGNEGNGISDEIAMLTTQRLLVPSWPPGSPHVESLNVAIATGIIISAFRNR